MLLNQPQRKLGQSCANSQQRIDRFANRRHAYITQLCATLTQFALITTVLKNLNA